MTKPSAPALPATRQPITCADGTVSTYQRTASEVAEIAAFKQSFANEAPPLAPFKVTKTGNAQVVSFDHPDQALVGTRLAAVLGSPDSAFCDFVLAQLAGLASAKNGDLDPKNLDHLLATVKAIGPKDPIESLLAAQMAAVHNATITAAKQLKTAEFADTRDYAMQALNKLARTFAVQVETLKKHRSTGEQTVRVQHVTVNDGGQAIVAAEVQAGGGGNKKRDNQPHEPVAEPASPADASGPALLSHVEALGQSMPSPGIEGPQGLPLPRRTRRSAKGHAQRPLSNRRTHA